MPLSDVGITNPRNCFWPCPDVPITIDRSREDTLIAESITRLKARQHGGPPYRVHRRNPHPYQAEIIASGAKRRIVRAGRRGGKTVGAAIEAVDALVANRRVLYCSPTGDQVEAFWREVKLALAEGIQSGHLRKNETLHIIEVPGSLTRIRAKTAWNADTLRGDFADLLILDEWQLMDEQAWDLVGAPMLLDNNGDALFIYTPPSLRSRSTSKARDPLHASKMFAAAAADTSGRWQAFHFRSQANPHISAEALAELAQDMTSVAYRQEIGAEDIAEAPGALWKREWIEKNRVLSAPDLSRIVVAVDPAGSNSEQASEIGIVGAGVGMCECKGSPELHGFVIADRSGHYTVDGWARKVIAVYNEFEMDRVVAERNFGGDMVEHALRTVDRDISFSTVTASRGKQVRAEPVAALYEQGKIHHVGDFTELEDQLTSWEPGMDSPDRLDACVWALSWLMLGKREIQAF